MAKSNLLSEGFSEPKTKKVKSDINMHSMGMEMPKMPTHNQMLKDSARAEMRHATGRWVRGEISSRTHNAIHRRAKMVIAGKRVH